MNMIKTSWRHTGSGVPATVIGFFPESQVRKFIESSPTLERLRLNSMYVRPTYLPDSIASDDGVDLNGHHLQFFKRIIHAATAQYGTQDQRLLRF